MGDSEAVLNLEEVRRKIQEEKPGKRRELLEGFATQPGEEVDRLLMSFLEDGSAEVRRSVVAIMRRRGFEDREFYARAAEDASALVKRTALAALKSLDRLQQRRQTLSYQLFRRVGGPAGERVRDESYYVRVLASKDKQTRLEGIQKLAEVDTPWSSQILLRSLRDESWTNRTTGVAALARRRELDLDAVYERLHDQLWYLRSTAIEILGLRKERSAVERMAHLSRDTNVEVRCALADALGRIGGESALRLLEVLLGDSNYTVRTKAENAVKAIRRTAQAEKG